MIVVVRPCTACSPFLHQHLVGLFDDHLRRGRPLLEHFAVVGIVLVGGFEGTLKLARYAGWLCGRCRLFLAFCKSGLGDGIFAQRFVLRLLRDDPPKRKNAESRDCGSNNQEGAYGRSYAIGMIEQAVTSLLLFDFSFNRRY